MLRRNQLPVDTGGLPDLVDALRWRWKTAALIAIGTLLGATLYVESLPAEYEAQAVVAITPRADVEGAGADTVRIVAPSYVAYLTAASTTRDVAAELGVDPSEISDALDTSIAPDSGNLSITVTDTDPEDARIIANAFADRALDLAERDRLLTADLIAPAVTPASPSGPPRKLFEAAALLVGILFGIAVALLLERGRPRIRSWRDIAELTAYPVLARIPRARIMRARLRESFSDPSVGAAFRTLRTNVDRLLPQDHAGAFTMMVTSPQSGDGKSTVAALFAESLARLGEPTLLIDADLHRAGLSRQLDKSDGPRTADVMREPRTLRDAVRPGWVDNLSVLWSAPGDVTGDLVALHFASLLEEARRSYTYVVVDSPPLIGTDEGLTMATAVDAVLLVIRVGESTRPVNESVLALEDLKAPVLGAVGNRLRRAEVGQSYR